MQGREKAFIALAGKPLLSHVLQRLLPQVAAVVINANGDPARFVDYGQRVVADKRNGFLGPLAGVEAAFATLESDWLLSIPVDTPFFPADLAIKMSQLASKEGVPVVAESGGRLHPVITLWPRSILPKISAALDNKELKLNDWFANHEHAKLCFASEPGSIDPFFNINRPEDQARAEEQIAWQNI